MNAAEITKALNGRWCNSYGMALCPCHDDGRTPALKISDNRHHDDGIDVICFAGCDFRAVKSEMRRRGLLPGRGSVAPFDEAAQQKIQAERDRGKARTRDYISRLWSQCQPAAGTPGERYLREARRLPQSVMPEALRFHPAMRHSPTGLDLPCLVAAVSDPQGRISGLHRTYLRADGMGKAPVSDAKMMLGSCASGAVRLVSFGDTLAVGEGIESTIAGMHLTGLPGWAALSTSGLRSIVLPREVSNVVILADADEPGLEAASVTAKRLRSEGRVVRIKVPVSPYKDFADQLVGDQQRFAQ